MWNSGGNCTKNEQGHGKHHISSFHLLQSSLRSSLHPWVGRADGKENGDQQKKWHRINTAHLTSRLWSHAVAFRPYTAFFPWIIIVKLHETNQSRLGPLYKEHTIWLVRELQWVKIMLVRQIHRQQCFFKIYVGFYKISPVSLHAGGLVILCHGLTW